MHSFRKHSKRCSREATEQQPLTTSTSVLAPPMNKPCRPKRLRFDTSRPRKACRTFDGSKYFVARNGGRAPKCRCTSKSACQSLRPSPSTRNCFNNMASPRSCATSIARSTRSRRGVCSWKDKPICSSVVPSSRRNSPKIALPFSSFDSSFHRFSDQPRRSSNDNSSFRSLKKRLLLISASAFLLHADFRFRGSSDDFQRVAEKRPVLAPEIQTPRN
mmetsp:Transcript_174632/g.559947  ORF Transcript_174632/g.559947 Transcript_174632/m.559947 type:complete len:217 (+) Transcript_174632:1073-1723(+)